MTLTDILQIRSSIRWSTPLTTTIAVCLAMDACHRDEIPLHSQKPHSFEADLPVINIKGQNLMLPLEGFVLEVLISPAGGLPKSANQEFQLLVRVRLKDGREYGLTDLQADTQEVKRARQLTIGSTYTFPNAITSGRIE
jgi:hypothetical protein